MINRKTIKEGQRVAIWNQTGSIRFVDGPARIWLFREQLQPLMHYSAEDNQYLHIRHNDGTTVNHRGPAEVWFNPIEDESIEIEELLPISANEAIVIYSRNNHGEVDRRVLNGPAQYMPQPNEWLHDFRWHGSDPTNTRIKVPRALNFTKLRVIPDQTYFNIQDVRTSDYALLTVQVMIFFELADIEKMLDQTHDPIADFINAVTADVIDFAAGRTFESFKQDTEKLNTINAYSNLTKRASHIGYKINNVLYRGYEANPKLQLMHDNAIEKRTALQLEAETELQVQELADLKLERDVARAKQQCEMQRQQSEHEQAMKQLTHEQALKQASSEHQQAMKFKVEKEQSELQYMKEHNAIEQQQIEACNALEVKHLKDKNSQHATYLKSINELNVDLTQYLIAQYQHPDRLIRIDSGSDSTNTQLHMHEQ